MSQKQSQETTDISQSIVPLNPEKIKISYPALPSRNSSLRSKDPIVELTTNLLKLNISSDEQKLCLYSVALFPELDRNNYSLFSIIQRQIDVDLSNHFTRRCFSGYNLFASSPNPPNFISFQTKVKEIEYTIKLTKVGELDITSITDFEGQNQRKKSFLEKVIKDILLKNKNTIKLGNERTIIQLGDKYMLEPDPSHMSKETIFKGFYTSAQITENGLFMLVTNINKHVMEITVYDVIKRLKKENNNLNEQDRRKVIQEYFEKHKTVLTTYGSFRAYRIKQIDFDASPSKNSINLKEKNNITKTVTLLQYYKSQYSINIKDPEQPLLIVERKSKGKNKNKEKSDNKDNNDNTDNNKENEDNTVIYLIPELVYATGIDITDDNKDRRRNIIIKTKIDPNKKLKEIGKIRNLITSTDAKNYKGKDGNIYKSKSANEISKEWGIMIGDNLSIKGRILPQPKLKYGNNMTVIPKNGVFRSGNTYNGASISHKNFAYVYDVKDRLDLKNTLNNLFDKGRMKGMKIDFDKNLNGINRIAIGNYNNWENIKSQLRNIEMNKNELEMVIVFLSPTLEKYYSELKEFFINSCQLSTQFVISKKLQDSKRAGSIMFNLVEQINIKMGGTNFLIDFKGENILRKDKIYLILGLECTQSKGELICTLTSTTNPYLNKTITSFKKCKNSKQEKEKTLTSLFENAFHGIQSTGAPHPPDYIILYRQGGNYVQNKKTAEIEVPIFLNYLEIKKAEDAVFSKYNPKFIYVCCNLKGDLKFFEQNSDNRNYMNPKSGMCVDSEITQKDKYEFYIQPQYVNQGTATPCHYQVLYEDRDLVDDDNNLKLEELQMISFYLSFYYWTWSGAVRVPGTLKLASTAMDFCTRHLGNKVCLPGETFPYPSFI